MWVDRILRFLGIKMAHFYSDIYHGVKYKTYPNGFRRFRPLRSWPYLVGTEPQFYLEIVPHGDKRLNNLPIIERVEAGNPRPVRAAQLASNETTKILIDGYSIPADGMLEYWFDNPTLLGSKRIADFKGNWKDQIWIGLVGGLFGAAAGFCVGLLGNEIFLALWNMISNR